MTQPDLRYPIGPQPAAETISRDERERAVQVIAALPTNLRAAVYGLRDSQLDTPYRDGGWTLRQVVHHVADSHMNAYARVKLALTEESPTISPYDQDEWVKLADSRLPVELSLTLLDSLHTRWVAVLNSLDEAQWTRTYIHPGYNRRYSMAQVAALYAWHGQHHTGHILQLRRDRHWLWGEGF
jgi:DinB superfamily